MKRTLLILLFVFSSLIGYSQAYKNIKSLGIDFNSNIVSSTFKLYITSPQLSSSITFTLPPTIGSNGLGLISLGNGSLSWTDPFTGSGSAAGNNGEIQYNSSNNFGATNTLFWDNENNYLGIGNNSPSYSVDASGLLRIGSNTISSGLRFYSEEGAIDNQIYLLAPDNLTNSISWTLPEQNGTDGQLLISNGSGSLSWATDGVATNNNCIGEGTESSNTGLNTVTGNNSFIGAGESNSISGENGFIGAGVSNIVTGSNAAILAGENNTVNGNFSFIASGEFNTASGDYSAIISGDYNEITSNADYSFIGAGRFNKIESQYSVIGAGESNTISTGSNHSIIGAGQNNDIINSPYSGIISGDNNLLSSASFSTIGGGQNNVITSAYSFLGGGENNAVTGLYSVVLGGSSNTATGFANSIAGGSGNYTSGSFTTVLGNSSTATGNYSSAIGRGVNAQHEGAMVIGDSESSTILNSSTINQFSARFDGGYTLYTDNPTNDLGVELMGGSLWASLSDSTQKTNIYKLNELDYLNRLRLLKIYSWKYKSQKKSNKRNYGPMAQDFHKIFGNDGYGNVGNELTISSYDLSAVTITSLKGLLQLKNNNQKRIDYLKEKNKEYKKRLNELKELYNQLNDKVNND